MSRISNAKSVGLVIGLSIFWFAVLPFRFSQVSFSCMDNERACMGYGVATKTSYHWYWLGGYKLVTGAPTSLAVDKREVYASTHEVDSNWPVVIFALSAGLLGAATYIAVAILLRPRNDVGM